MALLVIIALSCNEEEIQVGEQMNSANVTSVENQLLAMVNDYRIAQGYSPLDFSEVAYSYANQHNVYMIGKGGLSHDHFSARASGISKETNAEYVAENVAKDYLDAIQALEGWLSSPSHKTTIEGDFSHTAISVMEDGAGNYYYTQLFYK